MIIQFVFYQQSEIARSKISKYAFTSCLISNLIAVDLAESLIKPKSPPDFKTPHTFREISLLSKKSTSNPLTPSTTTSLTGAVSDPITTHPDATASNIDQDNTKGYVK